MFVGACLPCYLRHRCTIARSGTNALPGPPFTRHLCAPTRRVLFGVQEGEEVFGMVSDEDDTSDPRIPSVMLSFADAAAIMTVHCLLVVLLLLCSPDAFEVFNPSVLS